MTRVFAAEELSILELVHDSPRDDGVRLSYAAWLENNGKPEYAELIRLQCDSPYVPVSINDRGPPTRNELVPFGPDFSLALQKAGRIKEILRRSYKDLFYPVPTGAKRRGSFIRGLPLYDAELTGKNAMATAARLVARVSPLGRFHLRLATDNLAEWVDHPIMRLVDRLWISLPKDCGQATLDIANLSSLAGSALPDRLRELMIYAPMDVEAELIYRAEVKRDHLVSFPF